MKKISAPVAQIALLWFMLLLSWTEGVLAAPITVSHSPLSPVAGQNYTISWSSPTASQVFYSCNSSPAGGFSGYAFATSTVGSLPITAPAGWTGTTTCGYLAYDKPNSATYTYTSDTINVTAAPVVVPAATITVTHSPANFVAGKNYNIEYSTQNAASLQVNCTPQRAGGYSESKSVATSGNLSGTALAAWVGNPSTCVWTAYNSAGKATIVYDTVTTVAPAPAATISVTHSPSNFVVGQPYSINWTTQNATKVLFSCQPAVSGSGGYSDARWVGTSGKLEGTAAAAWVGKPSSCTWIAYNADDQVTIVYDTLTTVEATAPLTARLSISPSANLAVGQSYTLSWTTTGATAVSVGCGTGNGPGSVSNVATNGSRTDVVQASWAGGTVCVVSAVGSNINNMVSDTIQLNIPAAPTISVTRTPTPLVAGASYRVSWTSNNATAVARACTASGSGMNEALKTIALSSSENGTASTAWVGYASTCNWIATGPGGSKTVSETVTTVMPGATLSLTSPTPGATYLSIAGAPANVPLQASATPMAGTTLSNLAFYEGSTQLTPSTTGSINTTYPFSEGFHTLTLKGTDSQGSTRAQDTTIQVQANRAAFVSQTVPSTMEPGRTYSVSVRMKNTGTTSWITPPGAGAAGHGLGSLNPRDTTVWQTSRIYVTQTVAPQQEYTFTFNVVAPSTPGSYNFQWGMVHEFKEWFGDASPNLVINVASNKAATLTSPASGTYTTMGGSYTASVSGTAKPSSGATINTLQLLNADTLGLLLDATTPSSGAISGSYPFQVGTTKVLLRMIDSAGQEARSDVSTVTVQSDLAQYPAQSVPAIMNAGQTYAVSLTVKNSGTSTWTAGTYRLGSLNPADNVTWNSTNRIDLTRSVAPGEQYTFTFDVKAPATAGNYNFQWGMIKGSTWFASAAPNQVIGVTVVTQAPPVVGSFSITPTNVRVGPGQSAIVTPSGSATQSGGTVSRLELWYSTDEIGTSYALRQGIDGSAASLAWSGNVTFPAGSYRLKLRAKNPSGAYTDSAPVVLNVTDSSLLGKVTGVRTNDAGVPQLVGWACQDTVAQPLSFEVYKNSPPPLNSAPLTSGTANVSGEIDDANVQAVCHSAGSSHHFVVDLTPYVIGSAGSPLYVVAKNSSGISVVLPCADNGCTVPGVLRAAMDKPVSDAEVKLPAQVFLQMKVTAGGSGDKAKFYVDDQEFDAALDSAQPGVYFATKTLAVGPHNVYGKVQQGNITIYTATRKFRVLAADTASLSIPTANATSFTVGVAVPLSVSVTGAPASVKFFVDGTVVGNAVANGSTWSYVWTANTVGAKSVTARAYDASGTQLGNPSETLSITVTADSPSSSAPTAVTINPGHTSTGYGGTLPGQLSVSDVGAASYGIPIVVPPGTAGLQPELSLDYSSNGSNSMIGLGWTLNGLSSIHRCPKTIALDGVAGRISFDTADRLCLDGQRLLRADGDIPSSDVNARNAAYWVDGAEYRTEIEGFSRIWRSENTFRAEDKNGRIRSYSPISANGRGEGNSLLWALSKVEDRSGNYMTVSYTLDTTTGEYLPSLIQYGGNTVAGTNPDIAVKFEYIGRTDAQTQYIGGSRNDLRKLLSRIKTYYGTDDKGDNGTLARDLGINYIYSASSGRALVNWVQASTGTNDVLPRTEFTWGGGGAPKLVKKQSFMLNVIENGEDVPIKYYVGDFNGSGTSTIIVPWQVKECANCNFKPRIFSGVINGRTNNNKYPVANLTLTSVSGKFDEMLTGDMDGDGRDDLVLIDTANRSWVLCLSTSKGDDLSFAACQPGGSLPSKRDLVDTRDLPVLVPFYNDGRSHLMYFEVGNKARVCSYKNQVSCSLISTNVSTAVLTTAFMPITLSKQGQSDLYAVSNFLTLSNSVTVCRMLAESLQCDVRPETSSVWSGPAGDLNGDGLTDFYYGTINKNLLCLSTEAGVDCRNMTSRGAGLPAIGGTGFGYFFAGAADMLGDGVNRYWGASIGATSYDSICRLADDSEVCEKVDIAPEIQTEIDKALASSSQPYFADTSGVPAALNCGSEVDVTIVNQFRVPCWVTSMVAPASQDRLVSVQNGVGHVAEVSYARADDGTVYTRYPDVPQYPNVISNPGVMVKEIRQASGQGSSRTRKHSYAGAMADAIGRGSLGFLSSQIFDVDAGITTDTTYSQTFPLTGMVTASTSKAANSDCMLSSMTQTPQQKTLGMVSGAQNYFVYVAQSSTVRKDLDCSELGAVTVVNEYTDNWGNLNVQTTTSTGDGRAFEQKVTTSYWTKDSSNKDNSNYLAGLPLSVATKRTDGKDLTRTVQYTYNKISGLLETETVEPDNATLKVVTNYGRDSKFGQVNKVTQSWTNPFCTDINWPEKPCVTNATRVFSEIDYDTHGRFATTVKNALGHAVGQKFDGATGLMTSRTDANNLTTTWTVDVLGRKHTENRPDGNETLTYIKVCDSACPTNAKTVQITEQFHGQNRIAVPQLAYIDSAGHVIRSKTWGFGGEAIVIDQRYDELGRLVEKDHPRFETGTAFLALRNSYDKLNRIVQVTTLDEAGVAQDNTVTYKGLTVERKNARKQVRKEELDVLGQLRKVTDSGKTPGITSFTYEPFGGLETTTNPKNNVVTVTYDGLGRRTELKDPDLGVIAYAVDPLGQVYAQTNPIQKAKKLTTWMTHDALGRMTGRYESDLESHWVYDTVNYGKGQLAEAYTMSAGKKDYRRVHTYTSMGLPESTTKTLQDGVYKATQAYDTWGRLITQTYQRNDDNAKEFSSRYNNYGFLSKVERGARILWQANVADAAGRVTEANLGKNLLQKRTFGAYTGLLVSAQTLPVGGGKARLQEGYTYDQLGNVLTRDQFWDVGGYNETFTYDELNRLLTSVVTGKETRSFTYDAVGNLLSKTGAGTYIYPKEATADRPNAVISVDGGTYSYDANGNLVSGGGRAVTWTSFDMPLTIQKGSANATFTYGPEHQRVAQLRVEGGANRVTVYAGAQEVEPSPGGGVRVKTYWPNGIGMEIEEGGKTQLNWMHLDRLGSLVAITGEDGAILTDGRLDYDPWGKRRNVVNNDSTDDSIDGKIDNRGFTGHEMLDQLDLVHMNGRVYDPLIGKFLSGDVFVKDPTNGQNYNRYSYVSNNPTNLIDPTGFQEWGIGGLSGCNVMNFCQSTSINPDSPRDQRGSKDITREQVSISPQGAGAGTASMRAETAANAGRAADSTNKSLLEVVTDTAKEVVNSFIPSIRVEGKRIQTCFGSDCLTPSEGLSKGNAIFFAAMGIQIATGGEGKIVAGKIEARVISAARAAKPVANPISNKFARVVPRGLNPTTLAKPGDLDVFVTNASELRGLSNAQIAEKLTIPELSGGFKVIEFPSGGIEGIASPVFRTNPGFIQGGRTAGGAAEFVIPNGPIPSGATEWIPH